jgi:hypothetical protein
MVSGVVEEVSRASELGRWRSRILKARVWPGRGVRG